MKRRGPIRLAFGVLILTATVLLGLLAAIGSYELRSDPEYTSPPYIITLSVLVLLGAALSWWIIHVPGSPIPAMVSLIGGILLLLLSVAGVAIGGFAVDLALHFAAAGMGAAISIVGYSLVGVLRQCASFRDLFVAGAKSSLSQMAREMTGRKVCNFNLRGYLTLWPIRRDLPSQDRS